MNKKVSAAKPKSPGKYRPDAGRHTQGDTWPGQKTCQGGKPGAKPGKSK